MHIELHDIRKRFGAVRANDGISLTVDSGRICGLLGENGAGKTTLMKILSGFQSADSGRILLDGAEARFSSPADALHKGIGMLYQDPLDFGPFTVLENYMMGRGRSIRLPGRQARQEFLSLAERFGFDIALEAQVQTLSVGERQQVEILRLLSLGIKTLILDEPTTGISAPQKTQLFETLRRVARDEGKSVLFVSHKLEDVQDLCDQVTVLRQGQVSDHLVAPFDADALVALMFGQCSTPSERDSVPLGQPAIELDRVSVHDERLHLEELDLSVHAGEVVGIAGLEGSGQRLLLQACAGLLRPSSGHIRLDGVRQHVRSSGLSVYHRFMRAGVAYVPADRLGEGLVQGLDLREHFALGDLGSRFLVNWDAAEQRAERRIAEFNIKGRPDSTVESLSGGNQQRVLQALLRPSLRLLLMEHPTRGLDIESAYWIWERLLDRRRDGTAILFTSSDLDEITEYSDRVVVFSGGRMSPPRLCSETSCEQLGYLIGGMTI